jgi:1-acyl-sn-glycerol-3-phosphate acyltransferase
MRKQSKMGPRSGYIKYIIGLIGMKLAGWKVQIDELNHDKVVIIAAPHTSNWDFVVVMGTVFLARIKFSWMAKESLFKNPLGLFMRALGGIPIDRANAKDVVGGTIKAFNQSEKLFIGITPSGTRKKTEYWKSGFYRIAIGAKVPIACGYLDYKRKVAGIGLTFIPTGNISKDMDRIREFYQQKMGKHPELTSIIRLKNEQTIEI